MDISLKDYLSQWKALIQKFFADNPKYAEEYANQMKSYLDAVKGYYSGAISGVTTILQGRISKLQKERDKAVKALEKEKEAALATYDVQIKAIEKTIKAKQKQIKQLEKEKKAIEAKKKPLQDEIDAINKANEERDRQLQLQKDLYELEKLQNQRTQFVLKDGQMVYQTDPEAAREARENVRKDEDEQKIAALEKQIEAYDKQIELIDQRIESINEEIELLEEEKELLEEQRQAVEEYYDKLIKETEEMFDEMIEGLEEILEKWQRLAEIETIANAWKDVGGVMEMFGYSVEDVLNDVPGAFDTFEAAWIGLLGNVSGENEHFIQGLADASGKSVDEVRALMEQMGELGTAAKTPLDEASTAAENVGNKVAGAASGVSSYSGAVKEAAENTDDLAESAQKVSEDLDFTELQTKLDDLKKKLQEVAQAIEGGEEGSIKAAIDSLNNETNLQGLIDQFTLLLNAVQQVSGALGTGGGETTAGGGQGGPVQVSTAGSAASGAESAAGSLLSAMDMLNQVDLSSVIEQFEKLKEAVDAVTTALGGGGGEGEGGPQGGGLTGRSQGGGEGEGGADSLVSAIETVKETTDENIGAGGEAGEGTVIGDFTALEEEIGANIERLGSEDNEESFIGAIIKSKEAGEKSIPTLIDLFNELSEIIGECAAGVSEVISGLEKLGSMNVGGIKVVGGGGSSGGGGKTGWQGTAHANGQWGLDSSGESLVGELGPEVVVRGDRWFTVGDHGAEFVKLQKGDIIFNHRQSEELLKNKRINSHGKAYANGSDGGLTPLTGVALNDMVNLANAIGADTNVMKMDIGDIKRSAEDISRSIQNVVNNTSTSANVTFGDLNFTCNGISTPEVLSEVENALSRTFEGMALNAYQKAMAR